MILSKDVNQKIKDLIINELDISLSEFCKNIEISRTTLHKILNDKCVPYWHTVKKICKYFGKDVKEFL